jgi:hypothetical protein
MVSVLVILAIVRLNAGTDTRSETAAGRRGVIGVTDLADGVGFGDSGDAGWREVEGGGGASYSGNGDSGCSWCLTNWSKHEFVGRERGLCVRHGD